MAFLKGIDLNRLGTKLVRDFVMIFAASAVWQVENPGIEGIAAAAVSCAGIAAYRVGRDLYGAYLAKP